MVIFGKFFTFSLPLVWLVASLGIIGLEFFFCVVWVWESMCELFWFPSSFSLIFASSICVQPPVTFR